MEKKYYEYISNKIDIVLSVIIDTRIDARQTKNVTMTL